MLAAAKHYYCPRCRQRVDDLADLWRHAERHAARPSMGELHERLERARVIREREDRERENLRTELE